jgi:hypothetical protein
MPALVCLTCILLLAVAGANPPIIVRGHTECPTPSEVTAALTGLVALPGGSVPPDIVEIAGRGASVGVRLIGASGEIVAEKGLPESMSCTERAQTAAVIVAAWEARLRNGSQPELAVPPTPAPPPAPVTESVAIRPTPLPPKTDTAPIPAAMPVISKSGDLGRHPDAVMSRAEREASPPLELETGAALLASMSSGTLSPAALLELSLFRRDSRFGIGVGAIGVDAHSMAVASGLGTWRRFGAVLDVRERSRWRTLTLEARAGLALTGLAIAGQALPVTSGATVFDPGGVAGLRLRVRVGRLSPWIETSAAFWPRSHQIYVSGTPNSVELSRFEAFLGIGASLRP